jgi:hypothetical protein
MPTSTSATSQRPDDTVLQARHAEAVSAFRVHAAVFAVSTVAIFVVNLLINLAAGLTGDLWAWWSLWVLIGWGLGIAVHGLVVRLARRSSDA